MRIVWNANFRLGELIFGNNRKKEEELKSLRKHQDDVILSPISKSGLEPSLSMLSHGSLKSSSKRRERNNPKTSTFVNSVLDESTIESLIDKMKSGMEVGIKGFGVQPWGTEGLELAIEYTNPVYLAFPEITSRVHWSEAQGPGNKAVNNIVGPLSQSREYLFWNHLFWITWMK